MEQKYILLLRHCKSSWEDPTLSDFDRPLNRRGEKAAALMAHWFNQHITNTPLAPSLILCSSALRARQTLARVAPGLPEATPQRFEDGIYLAEYPALLRLLHRIDDVYNSVLMIGHNPGFEHLAQTLSDPERSHGSTYTTLTSKYPTGALAVIAAPVARWRDLKAHDNSLLALARPKHLTADSATLPFSSI